MKLVLALPGGWDVAAALATELGCEYGAVDVHRFPDGEELVRIDAPVEGRTVILTGSLDRPGGKVLPMLFAADAARELGAARVGLVAPYLAYMRQDQRFHPGEAITSQSFARLLCTSLDFLVTVEPHLHRWHSLAEIYSIPAVAVSAAAPMADWIAAHVQSPCIIGPDAESEQWASRIAARLRAPFSVLRKTRLGDREVSVEGPASAQSGLQTPVIVDDIASTGHTLLAAAAALRRAGWTEPVCVCVHALYDGDAARRLRDAGVRVASCDTVSHASNAITVLPALADALRHLAPD